LGLLEEIDDFFHGQNIGEAVDPEDAAWYLELGHWTGVNLSITSSPFKLFLFWQQGLPLSTQRCVSAIVTAFSSMEERSKTRQRTGGRMIHQSEKKSTKLANDGVRAFPDLAAHQ
jgi:hypothetical protein